MAAKAVTVTLGDMTAQAERHLASGRFASMSELVRAGLRALDREEAALDALLRARVAFSPARDEKGRAVAGSFSSRFRWELPNANQPIPWSADQDVKIEMDASYGADGALISCKGTASKTVTSTSEQLCAQVPRSAPIRSVDGKPVPYHQITTVTTRYRRD